MNFLKDNNSYGAVKILTYIMGFWPYQNPKERYFCGAISTLVCLAIYVPEILAAIEFYEDDEIILELVGPFMTNIVSITKFIINMHYRNLIKSLFDQIRVDLQSYPNKKEYAIVQSHVRFGKLLAHGYIGAIFTSASIFTIEPLIPRALDFLLNHNNTDPLRFSVPMYLHGIDMEKHYYSIMFFAAISILTVINVTVASDTMFIILLHHASGLFAVTGYMMNHIPTEDDLDHRAVRKSSLTLEKIQYNHYVRCIKNHKRAIKFAEELETVYGWCFGIVILLNVPLMSVTATLITTQARSAEQILKHGVFIMSQLIHLFFDCYLSQQLMNYSLKIQECVMAGQWYVTSPRVQKLITLVTLRSQLPCKLTAGKIMVLSLETFTSFVKTAGSYFTVMNSMR